MTTPPPTTSDATTTFAPSPTPINENNPAPENSLSAITRSTVLQSCPKWDGTIREIPNFLNTFGWHMQAHNINPVSWLNIARSLLPIKVIEDFQDRMEDDDEPNPDWTKLQAYLQETYDCEKVFILQEITDRLGKLKPCLTKSNMADTFDKLIDDFRTMKRSGQPLSSAQKHQYLKRLLTPEQQRLHARMMDEFSEESDGQSRSHVLINKLIPSLKAILTQTMKDSPSPLSDHHPGVISLQQVNQNQHPHHHRPEVWCRYCHRKGHRIEHCFKLKRQKDRKANNYGHKQSHHRPQTPYAPTQQPAQRTIPPQNFQRQFRQQPVAWGPPPSQGFVPPHKQSLGQLQFQMQPSQEHDRFQQFLQDGSSYGPTSPGLPQR